MKKLLCAAASVAALALSMGPAFAESQPTDAAVAPVLNGPDGRTSFLSSQLKEVIDQDHPKTLISEIGGQIDAVCAFDVRSPKNYKVDLFNTPSSESQPVKVSYPIKCNFGDTYKVEVTATNGKLKNLNETNIRRWDVPYDATFFVWNKSPNNTVASKMGELTNSTATPKVYTKAGINVNEASGRGYVTLDGEITLKAANTEAGAVVVTPVGGTQKGGYAWRAGIYKETLTMVVTPTAAFANYYSGTNKTTPAPTNS